MTLKRFKDDDIYHNVIVAHPDIEFFVHNGKVYYNRETEQTGNFSNKVNHVPQGYISLYEQNIDRPSDSLISRFITKDGTRGAYRTISTVSFQNFEFGDPITDSYPLSASISRIFIPAGQEFDTIDHTSDREDSNVFANSNKKYIRALRPSIEFSQNRSSEFVYGTKGTSAVNLICIPSIFYGSNIEKNTISLDYYITGTLVARLQETRGNGELIQTYGQRSGSVAGILLREQGIAILTGSWDLSGSQANFFGAGSTHSSWLSFGTGIDEVGAPSGASINDDHSYVISCKGTNKIPTLTMLAHADFDEFNYSNNPTFSEDGFPSATINSGSYQENQSRAHNLASSSFSGHEETFDKITYISKVGIYDEYKNLIAVATLANPIKKTERLDYTIKLRMDF